MTKSLPILALLLALTTTVFAQDKTYLKVSLNKGIGFNYHTVHYYYNTDGSRHRMPYSAGGGMGLQVDYGKYINSGLSVTGTLGYQHILAVPYEDGNNKVLASFNYGFVGLGLNVDVLKTQKAIELVSVGAGPLLSVPGRLKRTEEGEKLKPLSYHYSYGWQVNTNFMFDPFESKKFKLDASLGYKNLNYSYLSGGASSEFKKLNGNGLFVTVGVRAYL